MSLPSERRNEKANVQSQEYEARDEATLGDADFRKKEVKVVAKLDAYVVPILIILQLLSFLDRGNIGYAATQGMIDDIGLVGIQLNAAVSLFYPLYIIAELPAALIVKRLGFKNVIPTAAFCWGVVCLANGFVHNFVGLAVCRLLLGFFEGFLYPSLTLMLANWYKREEIALRFSYMTIAAAMASAFGGLIAWAILFMNGAAGYPGWRWLYIIEGAVTIVIAIGCYFIIPRDYTSAFFLTEDEKAIMRRRAEQAEAYSGGTGHYTRNDFMMAVKDIKTWLHAVMQIMCLTVMYGFGVFLPIILRFGFKMSVQQSQYLSIPVFFWGSLVYATAAYLSDRFSRRFLACVLSAPIGIVGYAILLGGNKTVSVGVKYFSCYLIATCAWLMSGSNLTWLSTGSLTIFLNTAPDGKRAASIGIDVAVGNLGGIISGQIYSQTSAPGFTLGHAWSMSAVAISLCLSIVLRSIYYKREVQKEDVRQGKLPVPEHFSDRAPAYRYQH